MSLFKGEPQKAPSYVTSTTETPKWLQDAIYNQIYQATNVANTPFTPYSGTLVAGATPLQKQAYETVAANQGAWKPAFEQALSGLTSLNTTPGATSAAQPYLQVAGRSTANTVQDFMSPYTEGVTNRIAQLGARNLQENLLPSVSDAFIRAGQFGGTRMGEFGSRALRDTQESILGQQSQALQSGFGQAMSAAQQEAQRQASLGATAGQLTSADLQRQQSILQQMAAQAQQGQQMRTTDVAALEAAGIAQQQQSQREADAKYQQYMLELQYPKSQLDWLSTQVRGMAPLAPTSQTQQGYTTTMGPSPLQQLATGLSASAGLSKLIRD